MEKQEFLENAKSLIKGSIHEGLLYTEIQSMLDIIDKYNESMHILNFDYIPIFNDNRYIQILDSHNVPHGAIMIDKDHLMFAFEMDNYRLENEIKKVCNFYQKNTKFDQYIDINDNEDDIQLWNNTKDDYHIIDKSGNKFIIGEQSNIVQMLNNSENAINARFTEYNPVSQTYETKEFDYNTIGIGQTALSIYNSKTNYLTTYRTNAIKTPNNNVKCVENKAYGYTLHFGLKNYIKLLEDHRLESLNCTDLTYQTRKKQISPKRENVTIQSFLDEEPINK